MFLKYVRINPAHGDGLVNAIPGGFYQDKNIRRIKPMKKITVIGPVYPYRGGIAHYTALLAQKLAEAGHVVEMISFLRQYPSWLYPGETDRDTSREPVKVQAKYTLDPLYPWTWLKTVNELVKKQPNIVIIQWWTTFWAPAFATIACLLRRKNIPVVYLIHNVMPHEARFWDRWLSLAALSPADSFIAQAEREAGRLRRLLPKANITVTPLPVYHMFSNKDIRAEDARAKLNLPLDQPIVLFFGIVRPYKGLRYLLQAFGKLKAQNFQGHLVIAGEFWEPLHEYQMLIKQLDLEDRVHIFSYYIPNEDIPVFFHAADLFVAPYVDGTQSASAKLALGFSMPMVVTRCVVDETLSQQEALWQVDEGDADGLATAIQAALQNTTKEKRAPAQVDDWMRLVKVVEGLIDRRLAS